MHFLFESIGITYGLYFKACSGADMTNFIKTHSLTVLLVVAAVLTFDWLMQCRKQLNAKWYFLLPAAVLHVLFGVAAVKLFALAEAGFDASKAGSMSLFGAFALMPAAYFIGAKLTKRSAAVVFDVFTVPLAATLLLARINCTIAGCCLGKLIPGTEIRWPTRELEIVFYIVFIISVISRVYKGKGRGRIYPMFMICYGAFRFIIEFFRDNPSFIGPFHLSHLWALITLALGIVIIAVPKHSSPASEPASIPAVKKAHRR